MNPNIQPQLQPPPLLPPQSQQQQQQQQPTLLQPHRPSTSCDRHPQEQFTGFCPSCLCERLAVLDPNNASTSSSARKPPTSSTAAAALKAIFRPSSSSSFFPELRRTKSFSASKNEGFSAAFEPQRKSCDVRGRSTLYSLFNQDDERKINNNTTTTNNKEPSRISIPTEADTRSLASSSSVAQRPVIESEEEEEEEEEEEQNVVVEEEDKDEIRVLQEPEPEPDRLNVGSVGNVIEERDRVQEIVEEEPEPEPEPEIVLAEEEDTLKPMKEHMDLDSQAKKSSGRDLKGSFWSAASVFSKKLQKWRQKQKAKKRGPRNGAVSGSSSTLLPVEKPIGRQFRETQSEIADYGFGRRSCDTDPRFSLDAGRMSLDAGRMSFDDPRYSFDEPRASWDGYLIGRTFPRMPLPTMLSVVEDAPVQVLRTDTLIPVEEPVNENAENENVPLPGGTSQTKEYYSDSSSRRRKSLDRSSSIRKTAAAVVAEMDELKPVSNAKVTPAAAADYFHSQKMDRDFRDSNSNSISNSNSLRDDCSETFEVGFRDSSSVIGNNGERKGSKKSSSRWSKAWSIWGLIHRKGGNNREEDEDNNRYNSRGNGNGVERSYSESWQEFRGERNGNVRGGGGGFNPKLLRSNSSVSWRNANGIGGSFARKSDVQANGYDGRKARDEFVLERNRSARYSPNNMDNGLLRLYLTPSRGGRRNGSGKGRTNQAHSIARSVLRLY